MSAQPAHRYATWDDVVAAPEHMTAELISGDLILLPRPSARHGRLALRIAQSLAGKDRDAPDGWVIIPEAELHLGRPDPRSLVLVPDFSGWRVDAVPDIDDAIAVEVVPDWVCEILSPSTQRHDRLVKMSVYASLGVGHAWLVDPVEGFVEVYALRDGVWARVQVASTEERVVLAPFGVVEVGRWFL
jgi:Uma2 family endonuclease